ncbi:MAG: LamB/YcsF family protein [Granulosicoccus sp.]
MKIDINADLGEGFGPYTIADDSSIMANISSANVACGYHAGDPLIMDRTIRMAREHGVDLGAHVSFPDRMGFGRRKIDMTHAELETHVLYQLGALDGLARRIGHRITHINPHGALGNLASADQETADALARAALAFDPDMTFLVLPGSALDIAAAEQGGRCVRLFLADRGYLANGQLAPRGQAGALVHDPEKVVERVINVIENREIDTLDGVTIPMPVQSILLHSDTEGAAELSLRIKRGIIERGFDLAPLSQHN